MYSADPNYFGASAHINGPLTALRDGDDGPNGVYKYGGSGSFPTDTFNATNYWVDVVFTAQSGPDTTAPTVISTLPGSNATGINTNANVTATFSELMDASSINTNTFELRDDSEALVDSTVTYNSETRTATLDPTVALAYSTTYTVTLRGGANDPRPKDAAGNALAANFSWTFTTAPPPPPPDLGPGGPILVVSASSNPFSLYYSEILRAEGLNAFTIKDVSTVSASTLADYQVVIVGEIPLTSSQAAMFGDWVNAGGNLIAMRPDADLSALLGLTGTGQTLSNGYMLVDTSTQLGSGIVGQTIQFHGTADRYTLSGAASIAALYSDPSTATSNPAVTLRSVGSNGGQAAAFTYDLARSVVYTRQGNPAWAGDERDGQDGPIRSDDLFYGAKAGDVQPDWVNLDEVSIPQADEQQRLLAKLVTQMNLDKTPLPRFWYFPKGLKAVVVMTGDDHASGGTAGQFDNFKAASPSGCSVDDWECVRSTSYVFPDSPLTNAQAAAYQADGFEIGVHVNTGCANFTPSSLESNFADQIADWSARYTSIALPVTNRTHCIAWSDWVTHPKVELAHGVRLDTNYYYWPGAWVNDRPGMFTGSGMPMRFADTDGTMIDVYQAATQLTDESNQTIPVHIDALLNKALGPEGYYGAFTANMHTDSSNHDGANAIVASAASHGVPVVSAKQMLTWLDGRNGSSFGSISRNNGTLSFTIAVGTGARNLQAMVPTVGSQGILNVLTLNGNQIPFTTRAIKGVSYAFFPAIAGTYSAAYASDATAPTVTSVIPANEATGVNVGSDIKATFSEAVDISTVNSATFEVRDPANNLVPAAITYDGSTNTAILNPTNDFSSSTLYTAKVMGGATGIKDVAGNQLASDFTWTFTTTAAPKEGECPCTIWSDSTTPNGNPAVTDNTPIEVGVKFRSNVSGVISGIRFYKGAANTGTHTGHLWTAGGQMLAEATFVSESASGWQTVLFQNPVPVTADTTYIASYFSAGGFFAIDAGYFTNSGVTRGPLTALQSGFDGPNGVYKYGGGLPDGGNTANYWVGVVFENSASDTSAPSVTAHTPANLETGIALDANVTVQFSEPMNASSIDSSTFRLRADGSPTDVDALVTYSGVTATVDPNSALAPNTIYHVTVSGTVANANDSQLGSDYTWSFTTGLNTFTDTTTADFSAGTTGTDTYVSQIGDGEVILNPTLGIEFSGSALPAGWTGTEWNPGGAVTVASGQITVDGARAVTTTDFGPGRSLEFVATFTGASFQHVGLVTDTDSNPPWALFSTFNGDGFLYARTAGVTTTNTQIPGNWFGTPHHFRIDWNTNDIVFSIDGVHVATHPITIPGPLHLIASDFNNGSGSVSVDWLRMSPYALSGTFTSRVFDAGETVDWATLQSTVQSPNGTAVEFETRSGNAPVPDGTWSSWQPVSGGTINSPDSRYIQYRAALTTASDLISPSLEQVTLGWEPAANPGPSPTPIPTPAGVSTIGGTVTYANGTPGTPIPNTLLSAAGSVPVSTTSAFATGDYELSGFGSGSYTVTPTKSGDINGITPFDAARIAQHLAGIGVPLNATQIAAGDVSNNGTLSPFDAAYIAQYLASIPNPGIVGTWKFSPVNRTYPDVSSSQTGQDY